MPNELDPKKLASLKLGILDYQDRLFIYRKVKLYPQITNELNEILNNWSLNVGNRQVVQLPKEQEH